MTRLTMTCAITAAMAVALAGCGAGVAAWPDASPAPSISRDLHFYTWADYMDPAMVEAFEAEFGITVTIETFADENEMASAIAADTGRFDLLIASDYLAGEMANQKLLAELDHGTIANLANIDPQYLDLPSDPGNRYSVPYDWGTTGIVYNTTCLEPDAASWAVLSDARVAGRVSMDSDPRTDLGAALKYLGHPIGSSDPADLAEAVAWLSQLRTRQGVQFLEWQDMYDAILAGELCAAVAFNGDASFLMGENDQLDFLMPEEGSDFYVDSFAIPRDAPNKRAAELFIDYLLRPDVHAANTAFTGYGNPNRASMEAGLIDAVLLDDPVIYPSHEGLEAWPVFDRARRALWNKAWADVQRADAKAIAP